MNITFPRKRRLTKTSLSVIIVLVLVVSYMIAWDRTRGTQKRFDKAIMLMASGRYEESLKLFEKVLSRWPRAKLAWTAKGLCELNLGRYEDALVSYNKLLRIDPTFLQGLLGKGRAFEKLGRYNEAIQCFEKIVEINPDVLKAREQIDRLIRIRDSSF